MRREHSDTFSDRDQGHAQDAYGRQKITAFGKVIYGRRDIGMGIIFTTVEPEDQKLLED
jgi:hypothetical protein